MSNITPPLKKGVDIPQHEAVPMWEFLVTKGEELLTNTAFITGKPFNQSDIDCLKKYYHEVFTYQERKFGKEAVVFNESLKEHYQLAESYSPKVAEVLEIDPLLLQAVILTHDFGRLFSHRRGRNNAIERSLTEKLGFDKKFRQLLPNDTLWTDVDQESILNRVKEMTSNNKGIAGAVEIIDVLAKWSDKSNSKLRRWGNVIESSTKAQLNPDPETMWPSELSRQKKITSSQGKDAIKTKYDALEKWFEEKSGCNINEITDEVEMSLKSNPLSNTWF